MEWIRWAQWMNQPAVRLCFFILCLILLILSALFPSSSQGAPPPAASRAPQEENSSSPSSQDQPNKAEQSEEEDYSTTPFTSYGEFHSLADEEADSKFFQYGRFFGVSLGIGAQIVDGNRGALWQGGFPVVDFKLHYWFDFNVALDLGFFTAQQFFQTTAQGLGHVDVNMVHAGVDIKYYLQTRDLSSAISFASPYLLAGVGSFSKTQNSNAQASQDNDTSLGISLGAGLEFVISPRKTYFQVEGKFHTVTFKDTFTTLFQSVGVPNLTGNFYTVTGGLLFVW